MKVRKIVAALAAVSMLAAVSAQSVFAADTVTISVEKVTAEAGAAFSLDVKLADVPTAGISVLDFALEYDANVITVTGVKAGAITEKGADGQETFDGAPAFDADYSIAGSVGLMYITGLEDSAYWVTEDGVFATITGTVKEGAAVGTSTDVTVTGISRKETGSSNSATNTSAYAGRIDADGTVTEYTVNAVAGSVTVGGATGDVLYGDTNDDGDVTIVDVVMLCRYAMGAETVTEQGKINADVDMDGKADATDASYIIQSLVKLVTLPIK